MEDLDTLFEVGPELKWFFTGGDPLNELYLRSALRGVFSIGFDSGLDMGYQGLHGGVNLIYNIDGAVFDDSPLVRQDNNFFFGTVLTWRIYSSQKMVKVNGEVE